MLLCCMMRRRTKGREKEPNQMFERELHSKAKKGGIDNSEIIKGVRK